MSESLRALRGEDAADSQGYSKVAILIHVHIGPMESLFEKKPNCRVKSHEAKVIAFEIKFTINENGPTGNTRGWIERNLSQLA